MKEKKIYSSYIVKSLKNIKELNVFSRSLGHSHTSLSFAGKKGHRWGKRSFLSNDCYL